MRFSLTFLFAILTIGGCIIQSHSRKVLVLLGEEIEKDDYSQFFKLLTNRNFEIIYKSSSDSLLNVRGEFRYGNLIVLAPNADEETLKEVINFSDAGGNVFIAASDENSDAIQKHFQSFDLKLESGLVNDHFHSYQDQDSDENSTILTQITQSKRIRTSPILTLKHSRPILYRGIALEKLNPESPLLFPVVHSHPTAVFGTANTVPKNPIGLVYVHQARNNARTILSGSLQIISNEFFSATQTNEKSFGNKKLFEDLIDWAFGGRGLLKTSAKTFTKVGGQQTNEPTILDDFHYEVKIEEYQIENGWVPSKFDDVFLDLAMMYPYIRTSLNRTEDGLFSADFKLPDVYGIFTLRLSYTRIGYGGILLEDVLPIRPFRLDQYERFIPSAFPYYATALASLFATVLFSIAFIVVK